MKKKWFGFRIIVSLCAAIGWWGLLYPELALTPDTVKVSVEDENGIPEEMPLEWDFDGSVYLDLLNAGQSRITFRSKLLTNLNIFWETLHDRNENK